MEEVKSDKATEETGKEKKSIYFKILAALSFLLPLILYVFTLCPTSYVEDSGEFITAAYTLGVTHPPGYPLYCMIGKIFTYIPLGGIAWRVNFMTAVFGAAAAFILFLLIYRITRNEVISFGSAMLFSFSPLFWSQCVAAEVYSLNMLFLAGCLYLLHLWQEKREDKYIYILSFVYGLSITNHHFMFVAGLFFILFVLWNDWKLLKRPGLVFGAIGLFIAGLLPYLYIPIASKFNPVLDWGNPETLKSFLLHIQRKTYAPLGLGPHGFAEKWEYMKAFLSQFAGQFGILSIIIGFAGLWNLFKKNFKFSTLLFIIFISTGAIFPVLQQRVFSREIAEVMAVFYLPCYLVFTCYIGSGLLFIWDILKDKEVRYRFVKPVFTVFILLLVLTQILFNYHKNDLSNNYYIYDITKSSLAVMDKDSYVIAQGDNPIFNILYLQEVEGYRKDVKMFDGVGYVSYGYLGEDIIFNPTTEKKLTERQREVYTRMMDEGYPGRSMYFTDPFYFSADSKYLLDYYGPVFKAVRRDEPVDPKTVPIEKIHVRNLFNDKIYKDYYVRQLLSAFLDRMARYYVSVSDMENAALYYSELYKYDNPFFLNNAGAFFLNIKEFDKSFNCLDKARSIDPGHYLIYYNLGIYHDYKGEAKDALVNYLKFAANCNKSKSGIPYNVEYIEWVAKRIPQLREHINKQSY
ncbi:MAG: DUF2723 domain-containing protein [Armatimonadota bacterium]